MCGRIYKMIADIIFEGKQYRFRVGLLSSYDRYKTEEDVPMSYELTCISEEFPDKLKCLVFSYEDFKKDWRNGSIKVIM